MILHSYQFVIQLILLNRLEDAILGTTGNTKIEVKPSRSGFSGEEVKAGVPTKHTMNHRRFTLELY